MEIDENLQRAELSPAEEAMHIARRKVVWEDLQKQQSSGESGINCPTLPKPKTGRGHKQFANEVASVVGGGRNAESVKRDVNRKILRAEELGTDLHKIAGTSLDKGYRALLALSSETTAPEIRAEVIERASRGEKVTAAEIEKLKKQLLRKKRKGGRKKNAAGDGNGTLIRARFRVSYGNCRKSAHIYISGFKKDFIMNVHLSKIPVTQARAARYPFHNPLTEITLFVTVISLFMFFSLLLGVIRL